MSPEAEAALLTRVRNFEETARRIFDGLVYIGFILGVIALVLVVLTITIMVKG